MSDWIAQYSAALDVRDAREKAHKPYIDAYTRLADRTAGQATQPALAEQPSSTASPPPIVKGSSRGKASPAPAESGLDNLAQLRNDLATTQKARVSLQAEVNELTTNIRALELQQKSSTSHISQLTQQKSALERRLRDREEELRGKQKLVEDAQDEMVAQGLQLSVAEARAEKFEKENKELVERWMKRMGEEAERVNRESRWD